MFNGGVAFGVDKVLIPPGFGGNCDDIKETQITVTTHSNPPYEKRWRLVHLPIVLSARKP